MISAERTRLTDDLEYWTGRSWIPRYARVELSGHGGQYLDLSKGKCRTSDGYPLHRPGRLADISTILSVSANGSAIDADDVEVDGRHLIYDNGWPVATTQKYNIAVEYVYGLPTLVDGVDRIALKELVNRLVPSAWPDRVISADTEYGTTRFVQPGGPMHNVSQLPEVNDWVSRHDSRVWL